jgi:transcriptional regulator with XRE-family HTH domain
MDNRAEVREFLISRRAKLTPQQAGLPNVGNRRVPGLRRSEVAALADVSIEYYSKLERGALAGASATVLDAIARALQLDDAERAHLFHLAHAADGTSAGMRPRRRPAKRWTPRPSLQWVLDTVTAPAIVRNGLMDLLATNHLGRAMHSLLYDTGPDGQPNFARYTFLDDDSHRFYPDWTSLPTPAWPSCAQKPAATPMTRVCTTSSGSCPRAARTSAAAGARTTSATTAPVANTSITMSWAIWSWHTRAST